MGREERDRRKQEKLEKQRQRQIKAGVTVESTKEPRTEQFENVGFKKIEWSFELFDHSKDWRTGNDAEVTFCQIGEHLKSYSRMTWNEVFQDPKRDHPTPLSDICSEAQKRLIDMRLDDFDSLWRFRFGGTKRLWGVKVGHVFQVIWWDPEHQVYPTEKKNT